MAAMLAAVTVADIGASLMDAKMPEARRLLSPDPESEINTASNHAMKSFIRLSIPMRGLSICDIPMTFCSGGLAR